MKFSTIKKKYKNQWVLLECTKTTRDQEILEANVLEHNRNKTKVERAMDSYVSPDRLLALEYLGTVPKNVVYIL